MSLQKFNTNIYKILENESRNIPENSCDCACHGFGMFHHNPCMSILSNLKCFECECKPIPFNASEITRLQSEVRRYWKKLNGIPKNMVWTDFPDWIRKDSIFMKVIYHAKMSGSI